MSTNHQSTTVAPGNNPDGLRERVAQLIRHYVDTRSPAIAASVVRHIEQAGKDVKDVQVSSRKISAHFRKIEAAELDALPEPDAEDAEPALARLPDAAN